MNLEQRKWFIQNYSYVKEPFETFSIVNISKYKE